MPPDTTTRRFPAPWRVASIPAGWRVDDTTGMPLAYIYGDDKPESVNERKLSATKRGALRQGSHGYLSGRGARRRQATADAAILRPTIKHPAPAAARRGARASGGRRISVQAVRLAPTGLVTFASLIRSRMACRRSFCARLSSGQRLVGPLPGTF
jgi:hypothetical protein